MNTRLLQSTAERIQSLNEWSGKTIAWLTLGMVITTFVVVIFRYVFDMGWIWLQESISYMHAFVFMLGAAYTFKQGGHVRVDIFYHKFTPKRKALIDLVGNLTLVIPVCAFIFINSWGNVYESWWRLEGSEETGGLDLVYVLKTAMLLMPVMVGLQSISIILRNAMFIGDLTTTPVEYKKQDKHRG